MGAQICSCFQCKPCNTVIKLNHSAISVLIYLYLCRITRTTVRNLSIRIVSLIYILKQKASLICTSSDAKYPNGDLAHGGYSDGVRAHERFVFPIPDGVDLADAGTFVSTSCHCLSSVRLLSLAPMLCGGLTTFSLPSSVMVAGPPLKRSPLSVSADCTFIFSSLFTLTLINISIQRPLCFDVGQSTRRRSLRLFALCF